MAVAKDLFRLSLAFIIHWRVGVTDKKSQHFILIGTNYIAIIRLLDQKVSFEWYSLTLLKMYLNSDDTFSFDVIFNLLPYLKKIHMCV